MRVRAIFRAIETGLSGPSSILQAKIFYPASEPQTDDERNSGILPPLPTDSPRKTIIFLNGINCPPESYSWLAHQMCERGHLFVTFNLIADGLPGGMHALTPGLDMQFMTADGHGKGPTGSAIAPILDDLAKLNSGGLLSGQIDLEHIILAGHSAGGSVALLNSEYFPQIKAVFSYGAHTQGSTMMGFEPGTIMPINPDIPVLMFGGDSDGVISWSARRYGKEAEDSSISLRDTFDRGIAGTRGDRYLAILKGGTHFTFADPKDPTTGRPFLETPGENDPALRTLMTELIADFIDGKNIAGFADNDKIAYFASK